MNSSIMFVRFLELDLISVIVLCVVDGVDMSWDVL